MTGLVTVDAKREFAQLFNRLCVALQKRDVDQADLEEYHQTLSDVPLEWLHRGAERIKREPDRKWFPTVSEWRTAAEWERRDQLRRDTRTEPWRESCGECHDTGWLYDLRCSGMGECGIASCQRFARRGGYPGGHTYATPCGCRASNRTYQRNIEAGLGGRKAGKQQDGSHT